MGVIRMKNKELYWRIKLQRINKESRDEAPFENFCRKTDRAKKLFNQINRRILDKACLKEALIQFVISDITAFEVYFKDLFYWIYTFNECPRDFLIKCDKMVDKKFEFQDLIMISYGGYQLCDILLQLQNFQNLGNIDKTFSTLIKENFLNSLNGRKFKIEGDTDEPDGFKLDKDWYVKLDGYLRMRHDLTHDFNPKIRLNRETIYDLHYNMINFILAVDVVFQEEIVNPFLKKYSKPSKKRKAKCT